MLRVCINNAGNNVEEGGWRLFDAGDIPTNLDNFDGRYRFVADIKRVVSWFISFFGLSFAYHAH